MAMKETVSSLRAYFFLVAGLGFFFEVLPVLKQEGMPAVFMGLMAVRLFLLLGFVVVALRIQHFLLNASGFVKAVIGANLAYGIAFYFVLGHYINAYDAGQQLAYTMVGLAINIYLWNNAVRLSKELQGGKEAVKINETLGS